MRGKRLWLIPLVLILAAFAAIPLVQGINAATGPRPKAKPTWLQQKIDPYAEITVGDKVVYARIAIKSEDRTRGLSGTEKLEPEEGMIFQFPARGVEAFWMKDMQFPLDMIWIDEGKVIDITADIPAPPPGTPDSSLTIYPSSAPVTHVLEVNAGWAAANNITTGAAVSIVWPEGVGGR